MIYGGRKGKSLYISIKEKSKKEQVIMLYKKDKMVDSMERLCVTKFG